MTTDDSRRARLVSELRANLHRRKAQARAAATPTDPAPEPAPDGSNQPVK